MRYGDARIANRLFPNPIVNGTTINDASINTRAIAHPTIKKWQTEKTTNAIAPKAVMFCSNLYCFSDEPPNLAEALVVSPNDRANSE